MERMICQCCGEALHKHGDAYECGYCGATYRDDQAEKAAGLLKGLLDDFKLEQLSNARRRLYETTHEKYPSSQAVTQAAGAVLSVSPDDFMARMYLHSHDSDPHELISLLSRGNVSEWEAKETVDWLVRSLDMRTLAAVKDFADRHFKDAAKTKALTEIEGEALKLDSGVYDVSLKRDVFLCYSTEDMPRVIEIMETFEENALSCFAAFRNLRHGKGAQENYQEAIFRAMKNCRVFVFLSSNSSRDPNRKGVAEELDHLVSDLPKKPRVEFLLEDYPERMPILAKRRMAEVFPHLEHCRDLDDLVLRVSGLLDAEENAEKDRVKKIAEEASERAKRELQAEFEAREAARKEEQAKRQRELDEERERKQRELDEERLRLEKEREEQAKRRRELDEERERKQRELEEERLRIEKEKLEIEKRRIEAQRESSALPPVGGAMDAESMLAMMERAEELKRRRAEEAADKRKAEPVVDAIRAIGKVGFTPECRDRIAAARAYYSGLTKAQRAFVHNADVLLAAEREYGEAKEAADKKKAGAVVDAIRAIGKVELTTKCRERIAAARAAYSGLTEAQRAFVHNADVLSAAEREYKKAEEAEAERKRLEERAAAVERAIEAIGGVEYSPKCMARIEVAQRLYDSSPEKAKALVPNHPTLVSAHAEYERLKAEAERKRKEVEGKIAAIGAVDATPGCKARIDEAMAAFDALDPIERGLVSNRKTLKQASLEYAKLEDEAAKRIDAIFDMKILPDGKASVAKCRDEEITEAAIPKRYRGHAVTSIGEKAFQYCESLTSITIPSSVTTIGEYTFQDCSSLTSITIPDSVASIGRGAFLRCSSLTSIAIPKGVTSIDGFAFAVCSSLASITIPNSVTRIGEYAFEDCSSLASITIPDSVASIGKDAFWGCSLLAENLGLDVDSMRTISAAELRERLKTSAEARSKENVFKAERAIEAIGTVEYSPNCKSRIDKAQSLYDALSEKEKALISNHAKLASARAEYEKLMALEARKAQDAEEKIAAIGKVAPTPECKFRIDLARKAYDALTTEQRALVHNAEILQRASQEYAKAKAEERKRLKKEEDEAAKPIEAIFDMEILPDGNAAVANCRDKKIINATIPELYRGKAVTHIGCEAFRDCSSLKSITIPDSVTHIGRGAFLDCTSLTSIAIPSSVTFIDNIAFAGCTSLTSITIPKSVTSIGGRAFGWCSDLKSIEVDPSNPEFDSRGGCNAIIETKTNALLRGCENTAIPSSVTSIGDSAFSGCHSLKSITIPDSVTSIGDFAFSDCSSLTSITIPESVTSIGGRAFGWCSDLESIAIPDSVTKIGSHAFKGCSCKIHFAHKKPLFSYPKGFSQECLVGFKGIPYWGGK